MRMQCAYDIQQDRRKHKNRSTKVKNNKLSKNRFWKKNDTQVKFRTFFYQKVESIYMGKE